MLEFVTRVSCVYYYALLCVVTGLSVSCNWGLNKCCDLLLCSFVVVTRLSSVW